MVFSLTIGGFPPALSKLKIRLFLEKCAGTGVIDNVARNEKGNVKITLKTANGLHKLREATEELKEIQFGQNAFSLTVVDVSGEGEVIPKSWEHMRGRRPHIVALDSSSMEYEYVATAFRSSGGRGFIAKIERIQSEYLYKQFANRKMQVTVKKITRSPTTQMLFHGTDVQDEIINHGFDRGFAGKNATKYGRGVYFAADASYSHQYTQSEASGCQRRMFLAEVITGDYCQGHHSYRVPPNKTHNDLYDSCVDNVQDPKIFVVFRDASAYPTYLINYVMVW